MAGNATITLFNGSQLVDFDVWLSSIGTATNNMFAQQQVRDGMSWTPIRRAEMFLQFTITWPLVSTQDRRKQRERGFESIDPADGFARMNFFQDTIHTHQQSIANGTTTEPMTVNYINNSDPSSPIYNKLVSTVPLNAKRYQGWIQSVEKQYIRFQNTYQCSYNMNIITPNTSDTPVTTMFANNVAYAPTVASIRDYNNVWNDGTAVWDHIATLANASQTKYKGLPTSSFRTPTL